MNIYLLQPEFRGSGGGIMQFYQSLAPELVKKGCGVKVFEGSAYSAGGQPQTCEGGVECDFLSADRLERAHRNFPQFAHLPGLRRTIAAAYALFEQAGECEGADIVETSDFGLLGIPAVAANSPVPLVTQMHGSMGQIAECDPQHGHELEDAFVRLIEPQLIAASHRVQSYSEQNARFWEAMTGRPVAMIRPALSLPEVPDAGGVADTAAVFGRLQRWKGPHILAAALRRLGSAAPVVDWYGSVKPWERGDWPADRRLATDFPDVWGTRLRHHPAVPRDAVSRLQARALFNVVPSTWDVFNFTAAESMAAARPTIVSTGAGASELIVDGENGFLFEREDIDGLAEAIERVLALPEPRRREIGRAGRETVRVELDPARIAEQRLEAYEEAIRSFRLDPPPRPNPWLVDLLTPQPGRAIDAGAVLESVPMRTIAGHAKRRVWRRLGRGFRRS